MVFQPAPWCWDIFNVVGTGLGVHLYRGWGGSQPWPVPATCRHGLPSWLAAWLAASACRHGLLPSLAVLACCLGTSPLPAASACCSGVLPWLAVCLLSACHQGGLPWLAGLPPRHAAMVSCLSLLPCRRAAMACYFGLLPWLAALAPTWVCRHDLLQ